MNSVLISEKANPIIKEYLKNSSYNVINVKKTNAVYKAVSSHTDIYICKVGEEIIIAKEQLKLLQKDLEINKIKYEEGASLLGYSYPSNIIYNAVHMGNYFIHNTKYTDAAVLDSAHRKGLKILHVKQGYTNCSLVVIDDDSVITSDKGLSRVLKMYNIDVLEIQQGSVRLEGFEYGFLGGASGKIGNTILFNGNLEHHPDYMKIKQFIDRKGFDVKYFTDYLLEDIGSIVTINN